jgi:hypothetical protein
VTAVILSRQTALECTVYINETAAPHLKSVSQLFTCRCTPDFHDIHDSVCIIDLDPHYAPLEYCHRSKERARVGNASDDRKERDCASRAIC